MPFGQKCFIRSSCARSMTSDPDLEAKTRFSPRSISDDSFLGEGGVSVEGGSGFLPRLPKGGWGGGVVGRAAHCTFSPALPEKRVEDPCIYWMNPGPWYLPNDSFWSLDPPVLLLILVAVLFAAIGKGQSTNRHPRAIHSPDWSAVVKQRRTPRRS